MRTIKYIVLHCTASPQTQTVQAILAYWKNVLGWKTPGYHHLIEPNGTVHDLVPIDKPSNGVAGYNSNSIHISYIGGVSTKETHPLNAPGTPVDNRTPEQKAAMKVLVRKYRQMFPKAIIQGHRDFSPDKNRNGIIEPNEWIKACPSFSVKEWLKTVGLLLIAMLFLIACNPAKKVMKNKDDFDKVGEAWSKEHPCVNDTVSYLVPGDTITQYGGYILDTVYQTETVKGDTIIIYKTEYKTRNVTKLVHDTLVKNIRDTRAEQVLQNELARNRDSLNKITIERNDFKAQRNTWRNSFYALLILLIILIGLRIKGKLK